MPRPPHLMHLGELSPGQLKYILQHAYDLKRASKELLVPTPQGFQSPRPFPSQSLVHKTISLLFSKRSTRTRVSAETATSLLGGRALFLGKEDIQLGVNESIRDSVQVLGGMTQGIFARVGDHSEILEMAKHSPVPVINALSSLWHPTQILADLLTLHEHAHLFGQRDGPSSDAASATSTTSYKSLSPLSLPLPPLKPLTITYLGDSTNVLHDMLVTFPRFGHNMRVGTPAKPAYQAPKEVWDVVTKLGLDKKIVWTADPREAVHGADVIVTDTWISMGQEAEKAQRLQDFQGYQVTEQLAKEGGAHPEWKFLHCLPRKPDEVDDEVFYGPRSLAFPEAENRKWTIMALFDLYFGKWNVPSA